MYGQDYYTEDKKAPDHFLRSLRNFDPDLVCAWNAKRGMFEILRPKDPVTLRGMVGLVEPYDVVLECAETLQTRILDQEGVECAMRIPKDPGPWALHELKARDQWKNGVDATNAAFMEGFRRMDAQKDAERDAFIMAHAEEGHIAVCRDMNVARPRVPIGVHGTRGWKR